MPKGAFDIYATPNGYVAVTNEVRRQILDALGGRDLGLPELVKKTGRAKPTLSSVHMPELLSDGLIEERPHAKDRRKKIYHLTGQRIGSSDVPVQDLKAAVADYVARAPTEGMSPIQLAFECLAAAPAHAPAATLHAQSAHLGQRIAKRVDATNARDLILALGRLLEHERLARLRRLDLDLGEIEITYGAGMPRALGPERLAALFAGFADGVRDALGLGGPSVTATDMSADGCRLRFPQR